MSNPDIKEGDVGFTNEKVKSNYKDFSQEKFRRFRGKDGFSFRIHIFEPKLVMKLVHTHNKVSRRCLSYLGFCPACKLDGVPAAKEVFGCNVFVYPTDMAGKIVEPGKEGLFPMGIYFWKFGPDKYVDIRGIVSQWGSVENYDLFISTKEEKFQKLSIQPCPDCLCKTNPTFGQALAGVKEKDSYPVEKVLVKEVTAPKMVDDFGLDPRVLIQGDKFRPQETVTQISNQPAQKIIPQESHSIPAAEVKEVKKEIKPEVKQDISKDNITEDSYYTVDSKGQVILLTRSKLIEKLAKEKVDCPVMSGDQKSGWKKASDFGLYPPKIVVDVLPPPPVPQVPVNSPSVPPSQSFDDLFNISL